MNDLKILDLFFLVFHLLVVLFNLFGWIWKSLRRWNLYLLLLTGGSWFILGLFYGIGYCPLTDWHWQVLGKLGVTGLPDSYIAYLTERITGYLPDSRVTDYATVVTYFLALGLSLTFNLRDYLQRGK